MPLESATRQGGAARSGSETPPTPSTSEALDASQFASDAGPTPLDVAAVEAHLARHGLRLDREVAPRRFRGGLANINYLVSVDGAPFVLRRPPSGELPPGAHDMVREHRILSRLWRALPLAPRSRHLCEDTAVIGVPFQLIEYRPGLVVRGTDLSPVAHRPDVGEHLTGVMIDTLVQIHAVPVQEVELADFGRPDGFLARGVAGWTKRCRSVGAGTDVQQLMDEIARWLTDRVDGLPDRAPTLLHCDVKLDNIILAPETLTPVAVIDWDMGTRGDPLFDLATLLSYWTEAGDPSCMHRLGQMPTAEAGFADRETVARRYAEATGRDLAGFNVVRVLALFKLGVVFLQLHRRWRDGALGDDRYADFESLGVELLEFTRDVARGHRF